MAGAAKGDPACTALGPAWARKLRALWIALRWKPKDGLEAFSTVYPRGIPSEHPKAVVRDARRDEPVSADPELNRKVRELAALKKIKPIGHGGAA